MPGTSLAKFHQLRLFLLIVALISSVYLLTYRARIESGDTLRALDALTSQSRYGDWLMDESAWFKPPLRIRKWFDLPLGDYDVEERLNIHLAIPLLKLAEWLPRLGNIHTVWLLNIIVASLTAGLLYLCLRAMTYSDRVSVAVALGAGLSSNLWAYSQTMFREPLVGFFLLLALYLVLISMRRSLLLRLAGIVAGLLALYLATETKYSALAALPALAVFALPSHRRLESTTMRRLSCAVLALQVLLMLGLMFLQPLSQLIHSFYPDLDPADSYFSYALRIFLFSPGGSFWATSPFVLLSVAGAVVLLRQGKHRLVWTVWLLTIGYALGHALPTGEHWFGGLSWPPRFLVPILPILMLASAPILQIAVSRRGKWLRLLVVALISYGIWIQFSAVSLSLAHYTETLPPESKRVSEWEPGLTQPRYFRWVILPGRWADLGIDFVWIRAGAFWWGIGYALFSLLLAHAVIAVLRHPGRRYSRLAPLLALLALPSIILNLQSIYDRDPLTRSQSPVLHNVLDYLAQDARAGDVLLLPNNLYSGFVLNHLDSPLPRPIILPQALAQAASDKQPAEVASNNPNDWFDIFTVRALHHLASKRDRLFLLANTSAFMPWSFRPYERYLALHYYPLREIELDNPDDTVRLLEYSTKFAAPNPMSVYAAEVMTDLVFGDALRLRGFVIPGGHVYLAGDSLEISLLWQSDQTLSHDYTIAWFIAQPETGQITVQGQDSAPQTGFAPTSAWRADAPVWDNRALRLPPDMAPGNYEVWIVVYRHDPASGQIIRLRVTGSAADNDGTVGRLPLNISVE
ncbi:MAG: hypothetical protein OXG39_00015 [Chloroflexi bacterium]|nr:hypothetical protein [Chloroflexota bacterium]